MTSALINKIVSLWNTGKGYATIAKELGIAKSTISGFCRKNGLGGIAGEIMTKSVKDIYSKKQDGTSTREFNT